MKKISAKRRGLLQLISDSPHPYVYFPSFSSIQLAKYGLTVGDKAVITWAAKAGLVETWQYGHFGRITEAGKKLIENFSERPPESLD